MSNFPLHVRLGVWSGPKQGGGERDEGDTTKGGRRHKGSRGRYLQRQARRNSTRKQQETSNVSGAADFNANSDHYDTSLLVLRSCSVGPGTSCLSRLCCIVSGSGTTL